LPARPKPSWAKLDLIPDFPGSVELSVYPITNVGRAFIDLDASSFALCEKTDDFHPYQIQIPQVQNSVGTRLIDERFQVFQMLLLHSTCQSDRQLVSIKVLFDL
jgi:hypothetical protein